MWKIYKATEYIQGKLISQHKTEAAARKKEATQRVDSQKDREHKREEETKERDPDLLSLLDNNKRDEDLY